MTAKQSYYTGLYSSNHYLLKFVNLALLNLTKVRHISYIAAQVFQACVRTRRLNENSTLSTASSGNKIIAHYQNG